MMRRKKITFFLFLFSGRLISSLPSVARSALLSEKVVQLYKNLPPCSPFRQGYLHHFAAGECAKDLAESFGVSKQTITAAQELKPEENALATLKYPPGVTREKVSAQEKLRMKEYWRDSTQAIPWKKTVTYIGKKFHKEKVRAEENLSKIEEI